MASPVLCRSTGIGSPGAGVTCYPVLAAGARIRYTTTTEVVSQLKYHTAGVFSSLIAVVQTNTCTTASTVDFRKSSVSGASTLSIGAAATGTFEDLVHTDTIAANDLVNLRIVNAAVGVLTIYQVGMLFTATSSNTVGKLGSSVASGEAGTSVTLFMPLCGNNDSTALGTGLGATEAATQLRIAQYYTSSFLSLYADTNTRTTTSTYRSRKNGANGQSLTIGAGATGFFEDVTNTDTLVPGDLYNLSLTYGLGVGNLGVRHQSVELSSTGTSHLWTNNWLVNTALAASSTTYISPHGLFQLASTTEADVQLKSRLPLNITASAVYVAANTTAAGSTVTFRNNGTDSALTMSVGAAATGLFTNLTNSELIGATSLVDWKVVVGSGGTLQMTALSVMASALVPDLVSTNPRFGPNPTRHPLKARRFRPNPQDTIYDANVIPIPASYEGIGSSLFSWSPSRRPMQRRMLRPSSADGTSTVYMFGTSTLIVTTTPVIGYSDITGAFEIIGSSRFGWSPSRRPMLRWSLRPSSADGTSTAYLVGTSTLVLTTAPVLTADATIEGASTLIVTTTPVLIATVDASGTSTLIVTTDPVLIADAALTGSSTLVLAASPVLSAEAVLVGSATLVLITVGTANIGGAVIDPYLFYYDSRIKRTHDAIAKKKALRRKRR